ncbi:MAG: MmoB/DmpM family protein [Chloroflexi bacterium OHK40]
MSSVTTFKDLVFEDTITDMCGVTMNDSVEGRLVAKIMERKPNVTVTYYPAMIRIDGKGMLVFDMDELSEALGREMDPYIFQIEMSTHYGRMLIEDNAVVLYADFEGTREYL